MTADEKIDFKSEVAAIGAEHGIPQKTHWEEWGRSIARRVESETIDRCATAQAFGGATSKIERLYAEDKKEGGS